MLTEEKAALARLIRENIEGARELRLMWEQYPGRSQQLEMRRLWHSYMDRAHKIRAEMYGYFCLEEIFN